MGVVRIAIDPGLAASHGPEIAWTWRTLLSGIGHSWQQVPHDVPCDIAYVRDPATCLAQVVVRANPTGWEQASTRRIASCGRTDELTWLRFDGEETVANPVTRLDGRIVCDRDIAFDVFWSASGLEEPNWPRVAHGIFDLDASPVVGQDVLRQAVASAIGCAIERWLTEAGCPEPQPRWPAGKRMAACTGHDVDYPEIVPGIEQLRLLARRGASALSPAWDLVRGRRHHWHFQSWVDLEATVGMRSAFYFVTRQGSLIERALGTPDPFYDVRSRRFHDLFRALSDQGVEIGLHASYRACEAQDTIAREKAALEEASGVEVVGNRHHYWRLNPNDPAETLRFHERAGLLYDCSLFHDRYLGWRRGFTWPFFPFDRSERRPLATLQIPTAWMDDQLFGQARYNPGPIDTHLDALVDRVARHGGCVMADVHEYVYDPVLFPGWAQAYRGLLDRLAARGDVWFARPADVARHWVGRAAALEAASEGLGTPAGGSRQRRPGEKAQHA